MRRRIILGLAAGLVLALGIDGSATSDAPRKPEVATLVSASRLTSEDPLFGGFSALLVGPDGSAVILISDRNVYTKGQIVRDAAGEVASLRLGPVTRLQTAKEKLQPWQQADIEGVAVAQDGQIFLSYEHPTRVAQLSSLDAVPINLPADDAFASLPINEGIEALAIDAAGTLFALPEVLSGKTSPVYVFRAGKWRTPLSVPRVGGFRPVSADIGPDGRFYLLERRFDAFRGFASRLRRFDLGEGGLSGGVVLLQTVSGRHDNLEGLSVWRAPDGLRATMISDDNFFALQVTEFVEYRLPD